METDHSAERHWADRIADQAMEVDRPLVISTGISPSGEIHIGNMREVLTGDAVYRALRERGAAVRFNYVADNFDPLRKVYPFLDREVYEGLVGRPLSEIRCPCEEHGSYAEHFLEPFLEALRELRIDAEIEHADRMYKTGRMTGCIVRALERRDLVASILTELTGKQIDEAWSPFSPICASCGRMADTAVTGFSAREETVDYRCRCGSRGTVPMAGGGKLVWRIDWPARWVVLGVTIEPFGKDHATRGGSYDSGARIVREVFGGAPPLPIPYEWIRLKGRGDMSSSKGNVLAIRRILDVAPPDALRYLVVRERPQKTIKFDPGEPLLQLVDELDDQESTKADSRSRELSRAGGFEPVGVPFKHLVVVAQVARFDADRTIEILERTGYRDLSVSAVRGRLGYARRWLEEFAPDHVRFAVCDELPAAAAGLSGEQRRFLDRLADGLSEGMDGEQVHELVYELASEFDGVKPAELFRAIYIALLGKERGPRAGWFISLLGAASCAARFREAADGASS